MTDTSYFDLAEIERAARAATRQAVDHARAQARPGNAGDGFLMDAQEQLLEIMVTAAVRLAELNNRRTPGAIVGIALGNVFGSVLSSALRGFGPEGNIFLDRFQEAFADSFVNLSSGTTRNSVTQVKVSVAPREGGRA